MAWLKSSIRMMYNSDHRPISSAIASISPFGYADKPAEKHCWLICSERKTIFRLKKQAEKYGL
jgi:hypothetical protein